VILGFPPGSSPSAAEIRRKRKQLAAIYHPDAGGNTEAMRRVNAAADELLAELG
jgi:curved DNA-binding protein CbpA